ncbi:hypothetical protein PI125_g12742 [Phytophthora idaei]|nr:hypothetical protein PI125_g12742 [Phytophthora idaei]
MQAARAQPTVKPEETYAHTNPELGQPRAEVAELRRHAAATAQMMKEVENMRSRFANMMAKQP